MLRGDDRKDFQAFEDILALDMTYTHSLGTVQNKDGDIAAMQSMLLGYDVVANGVGKIAFIADAYHYSGSWINATVSSGCSVNIMLVS